MPFLADSPTELTTAATDAILALMAISLAAVLPRCTKPGFYRRLWQAVFISLFAASLLGAAAHGLRMRSAISELLWHPLYFCLGLTLTFLALVAVCDWRGEAQARRFLFRLLPLPFVVVMLTWAGGGIFLIFILFEAIVMLCVLAVYLRLALQGKPGASPILAGIMLTVAAAIVQSSGPFTVRLIWLFDHNGLFHLVQMPGLLFFYAGAVKSQVQGAVHDNR